jgi:lambda family phage portal protein
MKRNNRKIKTKNKARMPTSSPAIQRRITNTGYSETGASHRKGSLAAWNPIRSSPQSDIDVNLSTLRARSAELYMGTPVATGAIRTSRTNVIGSGLRVSPRPKYGLLGISSAEAATWAKRTQEEFDLWASSKLCDIYRKNNFYDMQDMAYIDYLVDGDAFAVLRYQPPRPNMPYLLRLQLIEGTRVCNPGVQALIGAVVPWTVVVQNPDNGNRIVNGVEIDSDGGVVAYHICNRYPYDPTNLSQNPDWARVEAFGGVTGLPNILQISHDERPEQYRGVPYLAPVIEVIKQVSRYSNAELTAAIIKAFFTLFFTESMPHADGVEPVEAVVQQLNGIPRQPLDPNSMELGPGTMNTLPMGYDVKTVDSQRSLSTFEPFTRELIKQIGAAIGQPYEVLIKSFNSSYTASRAALLQAWSEFKMRREWFARDFCQPTYEAWMAEAVFLGRIDAPGFFDDPLLHKAWCNTEWYGPVMGVLDPVKEAQAASARVLYGFSTREKESMEMTGTSWDENVERLAIEKAKLEQEDLPVYPSVQQGESAQNSDPDDNDETKTKGATI